MQSSLRYAKDSAAQAHTLVKDGEQLFRLAEEADAQNPDMARQMRDISLKMLQIGEAISNNARKVEQSFSQRF